LEEAFRLINADELDDGMRICSERLNEEPDDALALFMAAFACQKAERHGMAYNLLMRAAEKVPNKEQVWNNIGMACVGMQRLEEAEAVLKKALTINPDCFPAINNLALLEVYNCNPEKAVALCERSLKLNAEQWDVQETKAYAHMMREEWAEGWEGYEKMIGHSKHRRWKPINDLPAWDGTPGQVVHIRGEQGVGDEISYASMIPDATADVSVVLECDHKLEGLFRRSFPGVEVHGTRFEGGRAWAKHCNADASLLIGSLGKFYRKKTEDFPREPFLVPDPERRVQWRALLDTLPGKKVGIAWTGGLKGTFRSRRSLSLESLLPLLKTPGITWVSLQYQDPTAEIEALQEKHGITVHHWKRGPESKDYDDVAALVSELDSVVTVCTAVVHLCGALGKECHVMVPSKPRWWYGLKGEASTWYKSLVFHRQKGTDWQAVFHRIKRRIGGEHERVADVDREAA
jgi:tetratricopeptide (TPR) repeat protein